MKRGRENTGVFLDFCFQFIQFPITSLDYFMRIDLDGLICDAKIRLHMLPESLPAGGKLYKRFEGAGNSKFFFKFPVSAGEVIFSRVDMARHRRIPIARVFIFGQDPFLEKNIFLVVEYKNVY